MDADDVSLSRPVRPAVIRIAAAMAVALVFAWGVYVLLQAIRPQDGTVGFAFLLVPLSPSPR